jgi:hypothetical protein
MATDGSDFMDLCDMMGDVTRVQAREMIERERREVEMRCKNAHSLRTRGVEPSFQRARSLRQYTKKVVS